MQIKLQGGNQNVDQRNATDFETRQQIRRGGRGGLDNSDPALEPISLVSGSSDKIQRRRYVDTQYMPVMHQGYEGSSHRYVMITATSRTMRMKMRIQINQPLFVSAQDISDMSMHTC